MSQSNVSALSLKAPCNIAGKSPTSLLRMMLPMPTFRWHEENAPDRIQVESYITDKFRKEYEADVSTFAPLLLSMQCKKDLNAAIGLRPAEESSLFIEQYLDAPIEKSIQVAEGDAVKREEIIELSNLVATRRGSSQLLFIIVGSVLYEAGYRWLVFNATDKVERITRKFPFPMQVICAADSKCLGEHAQEWGRYYETNPRVIVGDIRVAHKKAMNNRLLKMALVFYRPLLRRLVRNMPPVKIHKKQAGIGGSA